MKILITGICGFVGSTLAAELIKHRPSLEILGVDNLSRSGSELNRQVLTKQGVRFLHGDIRNPSDLEMLPVVDWVLDAAANPSVLAGVSGQTSSRQLMEHNLIGTVNLLEYCKRTKCGFLMLSTSRVYSLRRLAGLKMETKAGAFVPQFSEIHEPGLAAGGVTEEFSTEPPLSLYGASKLASEILVLEYATAFDLPVHINRCGVLAGAGQFGKADQEIFSFWIHSYCQKKPLKYIGFGGTGQQVRDCLHPRDLVSLLLKQMDSSGKNKGVINVSGGRDHGMSLSQLNDWCARRFGPHEVNGEDLNRPYDVPWLILNSERAGKEWGWRPVTPLEEILTEIALHAERNPQWLELSTGKMISPPPIPRPPLSLLSIVIPARNEEGCICSMVEHLNVELNIRNIPHEIVVVDDGSADKTWELLLSLKEKIPALNPVQNNELHGFGRAVIHGLNQMKGDAVVIMMGDESDDCRDVARYWQELNEGYDCVFGSRFMKGGGVIDYPRVKLFVNRMANFFLQSLFRIGLNDTTNAFKAYRRETIDGCRPLMAPHFNLTVELPLKAIVRGFSWKVIPITWRNRRTGEAKLKIKEMGSRYLFICLYVWLEKYLSRGDYKKHERQHTSGT